MSAAAPSVAVITGASRGIGEALLAAYRKMGYAAVATSRTIAPSDDPMISTVQGDISLPDTADRVIAEVMDRFGRIDTLVNNAGVFVANRFTEYSGDDYNQITGVNLDGFFSRHTRGDCQDGISRWGRVVTSSSTRCTRSGASVRSATSSRRSATSSPPRS